MPTGSGRDVVVGLGMEQWISEGFTGWWGIGKDVTEVKHREREGRGKYGSREGRISGKGLDGPGLACWMGWGEIPDWLSKSPIFWESSVLLVPLLQSGKVIWGTFPPRLPSLLLLWLLLV